MLAQLTNVRNVCKWIFPKKYGGRSKNSRSQNGDVKQTSHRVAINIRRHNRGFSRRGNLESGIYLPSEYNIVFKALLSSILLKTVKYLEWNRRRTFYSVLQKSMSLCSSS